MKYLKVYHGKNPSFGSSLGFSLGKRWWNLYLGRRAAKMTPQKSSVGGSK
jgi:hypothetical protein